MMKTTLFSRWSILVVANVAVLAVLGFYSTLGAAPQAGQPPFAPILYAYDVDSVSVKLKDLRFSLPRAQ